MHWGEDGAAADRLRRFGEGERLDGVYVLPYGTDAERMELLRADCKEVGRTIEWLRGKLDDAYFSMEGR